MRVLRDDAYATLALFLNGVREGRNKVTYDNVEELVLNLLDSIEAKPKDDDLLIIGSTCYIFLKNKIYKAIYLGKQNNSDWHKVLTVPKDKTFADTSVKEPSTREDFDKHSYTTTVRNVYQTKEDLLDYLNSTA